MNSHKKHGNWYLFLSLSPHPFIYSTVWGFSDKRKEHFNAVHVYLWLIPHHALYFGKSAIVFLTILTDAIHKKM